MERECLARLIEMEDLGAKKTKIYSRLLTDMSLAQEMEKRAQEHEARKLALEKLLYGNNVKRKKSGGMSAMNGEDKDK